MQFSGENSITEGWIRSKDYDVSLTSPAYRLPIQRRKQGETYLHTLLVATHNRGKVKEIAELLLEIEVQWLSLQDIGLASEVEETGSTFAENAILKATAYAQATGLLTLADDSGLEVDALGGLPGVRTARFGGPGLSPQQRYEYLLTQMAGIPMERRSARFHCVVALATSERLVGVADGVCEGRIADAASGDAGFGYDPVFYLPEQGMTMAQLSSAEKQLISHRGRAVRAILPTLRQFLQQRD